MLKHSHIKRQGKHLICLPRIAILLFKL